MRKIIMFLFVLNIASNLAVAEDGSKSAMHKKMPPMTTEQRQKMADAHEKMATCLRSDKPMEECHEAMMKSCKENMGKDGCPMMGDKGKGMHHGN